MNEPAPARPTPAERLDGPTGALLAPVGWLWDGVARLRAAAFARGWRRVHRPPLPTLAIGNLAAGGTGKTPLLLAAAEWLERHGARVGVLSRGYGGDEGRILRERHPRLRLEEDPDRLRGLERLLRRDPPEVLLLDDAFQHQRLARDADVVLLDATRPFGRCLPAGVFRESPQALRRASHVILSRADLVDEGRRRTIWERVHSARAGLPRLAELEGTLQPRDLRRLVSGEVRPPSALHGLRARLAAGVGNPRSFEALCRAAGAEPTSLQWLPDHHAWTRADLAGWEAEPAVLVTEKDGVKLRGLAQSNVFEVRVDWTFTRGGEHWEELLAALHLPVRAARIEPLWQAQDSHGRGVPR
jgi:tetraacyldisaccharide 4'-kinase